MRSPVQTREEIIALLRDNFSRLEALGVQRLGLFGSFLKGRQTPESDVDILVEFAPGQKNFDRFIQVSFLLEDLFGRRVEVVTREALSPYIAPRILAEVEHVAFRG